MRSGLDWKADAHLNDEAICHDKQQKVLYVVWKEGNIKRCFMSSHWQVFFKHFRKTESDMNLLVLIFKSFFWGFCKHIMSYLGKEKVNDTANSYHARFSSLLSF